MFKGFKSLSPFFVQTFLLVQGILYFSLSLLLVKLHSPWFWIVLVASLFSIIIGMGKRFFIRTCLWFFVFFLAKWFLGSGLIAFIIASACAKMVSPFLPKKRRHSPPFYGGTYRAENQLPIRQ